MNNKSGKELEKLGKDTFENIGLRCFGDLDQVQLTKLDPKGAHYDSEHLEFDYLIPVNNNCIVGEITGRTNPSDVKEKYIRFKNQFNLVSKISLDKKHWKLIGIEDKDLRSFRNINNLTAFFITTELEQFDLNLPEVPNVIQLYKTDWNLLKNYADTIGKYSKKHFLYHFDILDEHPIESISVNKSHHNLSIINYKKVASGITGLADVFTFEISPYLILPYSQVYRRDHFPNLSSSELPDYQRPLDVSKLNSIRTKLKNYRDFFFPNNILCVLSNDCSLNDSKDTLNMPKSYGSLSVIDGQHRLFSYADEEIRKMFDEPPLIMVTAIKFRSADQEEINKYSAKTFVEINTNQTSIDKNHLDIISYEILNQTHSRALAAQVLIRANVREGCLYGLFDTRQTGLGIIKASTVITALKSLVSLSKIKRIKNATSGDRLKKKEGFENLLDSKINDLIYPETLINQTVICLEHFFNIIRKHFPNDWPERNKNKESSFEFAKVIAGLIKLLREFIRRGYSWDKVETQIKTLRDNLIQLRGLNEKYEGIVFDIKEAYVPDSNPSPNDNLKFFKKNLENPTSIQKILLEKHKRKYNL